MKVDPWGLLSVFDLTTYALILASILVAVVLFILLSWRSSLVSPGASTPQAQHSSTVIYVVAAFFQETYPEARLPRGSLRLVLQWSVHCTQPTR